MNKGKEKMINLGKLPKQAKPQTYMSAIQKTEKVLREEALKAVPEKEHLREDAYKIAISSSTSKEYVYPYILITTCWISPIEKKYSHLTSDEVMTFYLKNFTDPFLFPKDFLFYQDILTFTGSIQFDSTTRSAGEWAYSKAHIIHVLTPEEWEGDLYRYKDLKTFNRNKLSFNYFDYMKAWDIAFCYENRQKKHSWFIQFREQKILNFPTWFICWFLNWGLYPLILPKKIRSVYDDFVITNPSMKLHTLMFAALYQVPWIVKWDVIITIRRFERQGVVFDNVPYIGRRILIKWWDKFEFFKESIFSSKGIINLEPVKPVQIEQPRNVTVLLKELLEAGSSKKDLKKKLKILLESSSDSSDNEEKDDDSMSTEKSDPMLQDSQSI